MKEPTPNDGGKLMHDKYSELTLKELNDELAILDDVGGGTNAAWSIDAAVLSRLRIATIVTGLIAASFATTAAWSSHTLPDYGHQLAIATLLLATAIRVLIGRDLVVLEMAHPAALALSVFLLATMRFFETLAGPGLLILAASVVLMRRRWLLLALLCALYVSLEAFLDSAMTRRDIAELALNLGAMVSAFIVRAESLRSHLALEVSKHHLVLENGRLAAEVLLQGQERLRYHHLNSASSEGLAVFELGQVISCNAGLVEMTGLSEEEVRRRGLPSLFRPADRAAVERELRQPTEAKIEAVLFCEGDLPGLPVNVQAKASVSRGVALTLVSVRDASREVSLRSLADRDELTGLVNRRFLLPRLRACLQRSSEDPDYTFALLYMDLDQFKEINDTLGHAAGDMILKLIGQNIHDSIREGDVAARLGGDEFCVLIDGICDRDAVEQIVERLNRSIQRPISYLQATIVCAASIGISYFSDVGWSDPVRALNEADEAMYQAKRRKGLRRSPLSPSEPRPVAEDESNHARSLTIDMDPQSA